MSEPTLSAAAPGTAQPPSALTAEDYQQLRTMAMSDDAKLRDQATTLAQKLTPAEGAAFVAFQKDAHRQSLLDQGRMKPGQPESTTLEHREDNTLLGLPPETVAAMGLPVMRALFGPGLTMTARAVAGTKAAVASTTPVLKYEAVKTGLQALHVPGWAAVPLAYWVSGYRGNGKTLSPSEELPPKMEGYDRYMPNISAGPAAPAEPPPVVQVPARPTPDEVLATSRAGTAAGDRPLPAGRPVSAATPESPAAPPAAAMPETVPPPAASGRPAQPGQTLDLSMAQRTKGQQSASWIQSDLGIAAKRAGVTMTPAESSAAEALMREHGVSANQAVSTVGQLQAQRTPSGLTLSADEATQYQALRTQGKSGAQAEAAILKLRALAKKLKTPTGGQVEDAVQRRNMTGRWDQ